MLTKSEAVPELDRDQIYQKIFWRLLPFLIACYLLASIDRGNVAYAKLAFQVDLGFSETVFGIGAGIFSLGYIAFEVPSNMMLKRIGIRATLLRIMLLWGGFCVALAFMVEAWHFYTLRLLLGVAEAGFFPGVMYFLSHWAPPERRAGTIAIFMGAIGLAGVLSGPVAGIVMTGMDGWLGLSGWQWLFIVEGVPAMVLGIVAYFYLDESPADAPWLSDAEKEAVLSDLAKSEGRSSASGSSTSTGGLINPIFIGTIFACFAAMAGTSAFMMWIPTILREFGITSIMHIGLYSSGPFAVALVCQLANAKHSDRTGERQWHVAVPMFIAGIAWLVLAHGNLGPVSALLTLTVIASGTMAAFGPFWAIPPAIFSTEKRAVGIAIVTTLGGAASFVQPVLFGMIIDLASIREAQVFNGIFVLGCVTIFAVLFSVYRIRPAAASTCEGPAI